MSDDRREGLLDARSIALYLTAHGTRLATGTIRQWASTGQVERRGKDPRGRTLYDLAEVARRARHDAEHLTRAG